MTHVCVTKLTITGSDNGLLLVRRQAIIWTNAGILLIGSCDYKYLLRWNNINSFANWPLEFGITGPYKCARNHTYWSLKITEACNPKMVFIICERISCSSFSVKELFISLYNPIHFWSFCIPHHWRNWWLRWELSIVTRSYWTLRKKTVKP